MRGVKATDELKITWNWKEVVIRAKKSTIKYKEDAMVLSTGYPLF